ncbi:MAG: HEAT repeat domain-containing protein [Verrucomicrobia bacterium]|nr:HEAT repeat domain-containing protein [Verrucomicrobiota bacterium]
MKSVPFIPLLASFWVAAATGFSAEIPKKSVTEAIRIDPGQATADAELAAKKFKLAPGLKVELWAAEPMLANPVAFCIDERGRIYVSETHRLHQGVTDIRGHMNWLDEELAAKSTDDMRQLFIRHNYDGKTNVSERVTLIEDRSGSGLATHYSTFADKIFNSPVDGIASGVLARRGNVWLANIPNLWLLRDNDGDGKTDGPTDVRKPLLTGFGVRVGFLGHDLHGLRIGPDGKLYFSIGDRGASVQSLEGKTVANTEGGAIYRCNQDGSDLEIFHFGLRNPQELAFDEFGNLFTGDNNSDGGDPARWVYAVEGGDTGWRIGWQFIESAPWTSRRGPWLGERMCYPEDRAAHILPPIANIANGPSGLAYYPGTGLPAKYDGHFLLVDFKGASSASGIWSFKMQTKGASFDLVEKEQFLWNALATDVDFGYDGHVYFSDWIEGWGMTSKGRIYRVSDPAAVRGADEVKTIFAGDFTKRSVDELKGMLSHRDMRVRQEAQFALVEKGADGQRALAEAAAQGKTLQARVHGIWGLGQLVQGSKFKVQSLAALRPLLVDAEVEVRAQAAKVLGDARDAAAGAAITSLLRDASPRVRHLAAIAAGKIRVPAAAPALVKLLADNADKDAVLRHSGVMGLLGCSDARSIAALKSHTSPSVRLAAVVALRRMERAEVSQFLTDADGRVILETARAISEIPIAQALPALAALQPDFGKLTTDQRPALARRILSAHYRLGDAASAARLAGIAGNANIPDAARAEALDLLAEWAKPSGRDRITGLWRPLPTRDAKLAAAAAKPVLAAALRTGATPVRLAAVKAVDQLDVADMNSVLFELVSDTKANTGVRVGALNRLAALRDAQLAAALDIAAKDKAEPLRVAATTLRAKTTKGSAVAPLLAVIATGSVGEKQNAIAMIGGLPGAEADGVIASLVTELAGGTLAPELSLEVIEAGEKRADTNVKAGLDKFKAQRRADDLLWSYRMTLAGGNVASGRKIFLERVEASCARCHKVGPEGGEVGPVLDGIAAKQTREYLLESLVAPNAKIAPGFESLMVVLKDGRNFAGVTKPGGDDEVVINSPEDGVMKFKKAEVARIQKGQSAMPDTMIHVLSKRDIRDLVEFLASLK